MKEFDLVAAKNGAPVCTRDGHKARIICFDRKDSVYPIIALVDKFDNGEEYDLSYTERGHHLNDGIGILDLMMADIPTTHHEGYVNIRYNVDGRDVTGYYIYNSKEAAEINCPDKHHTVKMSWEDEI